MYDALVAKESKIGVIGLGYVGLPIALLFARHASVIGFDINADRVQQMQQGQDPSHEIPPEDFEGADICFTAKIDDLKAAQFYIVAVPTPLDQHYNPDLRPVLAASRMLAQVLKQGDYVVFESTVYPGCTEEDCIPLLEESGLRHGQDFKVGYSPERINPGDKVNTVERTVKIVSGCDADAIEEIARVYELIIRAGVHRAPAIKVAEAAKIIENTQRDLNIALMNELSIIFNKMSLNTYDVIEAAATKWNFQPFKPGLVGGHCIGVDPYYLTYKASELGYHAKVILAGRQINDSMGFYIGRSTVKQLIAAGKPIRETRVLIMGATFKENVADIRNSKVADVITELQSFMVNVDCVDPYADPDEVEREYGYRLADEIRGPYDAVIIAVAHQAYLDLDEAYFQQITSENAVLIDVKGVFRNKIESMNYWSL
jgi:UDP-N-acetyl-D-galactosamine dehydrogenase